MSLNGLDSPEVLDVYNATLNEAGGWLFLKYASRDEIVLLDHGKGGVAEARAAAAQYQESSPLYGLIMYRRKKVVIKYMPESTSRLLRARTAVHMQSVLDQFAPYETMVEIGLAESLTDTTLAAAFPLHTAAPSPNPSGIKLDEITEDAEEASSPKRTAPPTLVPVFPIATRKVSTERWPSRRPLTTQPSIDTSKSPTLSQKPSVSRFLVREESGQQSIMQLDTPTSSDYVPSDTFIKDTASTLSGKSEHEAAREASPVIALNEHGEIDFDKYYAEVFKTKVKLGPRLITVPDRSKAPGRSSVPLQPRAVSALPNHVQTKAPPPEPKQTAFPIQSPPMLSLFPRPPPIPDELHSIPRPSSRSSLRSIPQSIMSVKTSKSAMTPEKLRLMKAMELRKKQMAKSSPIATISDVVPAPDQMPSIPTVDTTDIDKNDCSNQLHEKTDSGVQLHFDSPITKTVLSPEFDYPATSGAVQKPGREAAKQQDLPKAPGFPAFSDSPTLGYRADFSGGLARSPALASLVSNGSSTDVTDSLPDKPTPRSSDEIPSKHEVASVVVSEPETADETLQKKRGSRVPPLVVDVDVGLGHENEHNYQSDDDFLDELHSATFEEATPISMSRSPANPFFQRMPSYRSEQSSLSLASGASSATTVHKERSKRTSNDSVTPKPATEWLVPESRSATEQRPTSISSAMSITSVSGASLASTVQKEEQETSSNEISTTKPATDLLVPYSQVDTDLRPASSSSILSTQSVSGTSFVSTIHEEQHNRTSNSSNASKPATELLAPASRRSTGQRPVSASSATTVESENSDLVPRNRQISSGIAKRMQALAERTAREANNAPTRALPDKTAPVSIRKTTLQSSLEGKPFEKKAANKFSVWPNVTMNQSATRDSVSVTAQIVRPSEAETSTRAIDNEPKPVAVSQPRSVPLPEYPPMSAVLDESVPDLEQVRSKEGKDQSMSPTFSFASGDSELVSVDHKSVAQRTNATPENSRPSQQRYASTTSIVSDDSGKSSSRTSRFFRRMSNIGGSNKKKSQPDRSISTTESSPGNSAPSARPATRRQSIRAPPTSRSNSVVRKDSVPDIPPPIVVGDMNIQFPGTLLWKRRWVEIDHQGNMLFTTTRPDGGRNLQRGFVTKFNLKELMRPYVPEVDQQEMPHCVLFDLSDGATLSCSSEDSMAQRQLLSLLTTYHEAWNTGA